MPSSFQKGWCAKAQFELSKTCLCLGSWLQLCSIPTFKKKDYSHVHWRSRDVGTPSASITSLPMSLKVPSVQFGAVWCIILPISLFFSFSLSFACRLPLKQSFLDSQVLPHHWEIHVQSWRSCTWFEAVQSVQCRHLFYHSFACMTRFRAPNVAIAALIVCDLQL